MENIARRARQRRASSLRKLDAILARTESALTRLTIKMEQEKGSASLAELSAAQKAYDIASIDFEANRAWRRTTCR